jgi:hypothetical protein
MANEPERPIEKLLRAAAQKRRDEAGAPLELHPATRRLLQGEVARTFAKPGRETRSFSEVLGQLWPRFAWGVAIFAVLAVTVYLLLPVAGKSKPEALLAKNEPMPEAAPTKQPLRPAPTVAATVPAPPVAVPEPKPSTVAFADAAPLARRIEAEGEPLSKDGIAGRTDREVTEKLALAAAPQAADRKKVAEANIAAPSGSIAQAPAEIANDADQRQFSLAAKPAPPASAPVEPASPPPMTMAPAPAGIVATDEATKLTGDKAGQAAFASKSLGAVASATSSLAAMDDFLKSAGEDRKKAGSVGAFQRFVQVAPAPKKKESLGDKVTPPPPVLASFQVEQAGSELRIVDGDGSVYSGYVQIADTARRQRSAKTEAPADSRASGVRGGVLEEGAADRLDSDLRAPQNYFFRVVGTNRSLNKEVVFTGNLMAATNLASFLPPTNALSIGSGGSGPGTGSTRPDLLPLLNSRITGKVVVGNGKAVEINALPMRP